MNHKCGHPVADVQNLGRGQARLRRIKRLESFNCAACTEANLRAKFASLRSADFEAWIARRMQDYTRTVNQVFL